ncbi:MAG: CpsB/CapC family capsule biosynthesis tyrosine phosphatase [Phycisphaeraceae bacterium]
MHSHLLPGIDDGCASLDESLESIRRLIDAGYVGTVCTPHCWPNHFPHITPEHIRAWRDALAAEIDKVGLDYRLWTGGELRIFSGAIDWMKQHGVPTLAESNCVLCDFWQAQWQPYIDDTFDWLMSEGYRPILAHPERSPTRDGYDKHLDRVTERGVILQGNLRCFTGEEGFGPDRDVRRYMDDDRYTLLALDMHRPAALQGRLDGIAIAAEEYGQARIEAMIDTNVRALIFETDA